MPWLWRGFRKGFRIQLGSLVVAAAVAAVAADCKIVIAFVIVVVHLFQLHDRIEYLG